MKSGSGSGGSQRGFTYVAVLLVVATIGVGLAATGEIWSHSRQREREQELLFAGNQFRQAIGLYYQRTPGAAKRFPEKLEDLLEDKRYPNPQRYLRKLYADPLSGKPQWGLVRAPEGGVMGVYSLSNATPIKTAEFLHRDRTFKGATTYQEWRFIYEPPLAPVQATPNPQTPQTPPPTGGAPPQATPNLQTPQTPAPPAGGPPVAKMPAARSR